MRKLAFPAILAGCLAVTLVGGSLAFADDDDGRDARATLTGYEEIISPTAGAVSTVARGTFRASVNSSTIRYTLRYQGIEGGTAVAAHIHFAQRHTNGGVSAFLCGGGDKPACPAAGGTVEGVVDAADVIGPAAQGIAAGQFAELVRAMRAGATYVNVHSAPTYPGGEIRGQIRLGGGGDDDD
jgi:hypothetical protein